MLGGDLATLGSHAERAGADAQRAGGLGQIQPWVLGALLGHVAPNAMMAAQSAHALLRPAVAPARTHAVAVEKASDQPVRADARQHAHGLDGFARRVRGVLSTSSPGEAQLGMDTALPV